MFRGRADRQAKVRGYRIELDEIVMALGSHEDVVEAAAIVSADGQSVEAFVRVGEKAEFVVGELIAHLRKRLPRYAIPKTVKVLDEFPRTTSGKIDRKCLTGKRYISRDIQIGHATAEHHITTRENDRTGSGDAVARCEVAGNREIEPVGLNVTATRDDQTGHSDIVR